MNELKTYCLSKAFDYCYVNKSEGIIPNFTPEEIVDIARIFEDYVTEDDDETEE